MRAERSVLGIGGRMGQIFLSYAREDRACAEVLARSVGSRSIEIVCDSRPVLLNDSKPRSVNRRRMRALRLR